MARRGWQGPEGVGLALIGTPGPSGPSPFFRQVNHDAEYIYLYIYRNPIKPKGFAANPHSSNESRFCQ